MTVIQKQTSKSKQKKWVTEHKAKHLRSSKNVSYTTLLRNHTGGMWLFTFEKKKFKAHSVAKSGITL